ncbi:MAG: FMN-binding protein [Bacteroidales bacterium]|nr:FMN-binding protein [Bacteroidales bacterium]
MMNYIIAITLVLATMLAGQGDLTKSTYKKSRKELEKTFSDSLHTKLIPLPDSICKSYHLQKKSVFRVWDENKESVMILATAKGRYDYFDFMVLFDDELAITKVKVLVYRSSHGYEVTHKRWLRQFKREKHPYRYGVNIDAISGATLSGKAITQRLNQLTKAMQAMKEENTLHHTTASTNK